MSSEAVSLYLPTQLDSDEEKKRKKKHKKKGKKKLPRPPKRIQAIRNKDKIGSEGWDERRAKNIGNFPSPSRLLLLGNCGRGKSTLVKNLIMHQRPRFKEVYVIHEDAEFTKEWDDIQPTQMLSEVPGIDFWERDGSFIKRAVVVDDLEVGVAHKERLKNLAILFRYCSTHKGLTVYFCHQNFFSTPPIVRKMASVFVIWKPTALNEMGMIANRVGYRTEDLEELFKTVATKHRDSICIDLTENTPAPLRLNIWKKIEQAKDNDHS